MKKILVICFSLLLALMLLGCSSPMDKSSSMFGLMDSPSPSAMPPAAPAPTPAPTPDAMYESTANYAYEAEMQMDPAATAESGGGYGGVGGLPSGVEARKVVTSAEFRISTEEFNSTMRRLEQKIAVSGSYIQQSESRAATEHRAAYASMTIRVPATLYGDFKNFLTELAELDSAAEHGEDVTVQYYDTEARLKVLQAQEERIKTFIANSKDLEEIFKIERELTRISTEIEQLTTVKNRLDNLTAYATVYVEVYEIVEEEFVEPEPVTFSERITKAFYSSVNGLVITVQVLLLVLISIWPLILLVVAVVLVIRIFGKRRAKRSKKNLPPPKSD